MRGYLNRPDETAGRSSTAGCTPATSAVSTRTATSILVDRIKDMIIRGGENIYPKEIEAGRYQLPAVAEAAVVGAPHAVYGEVPVLFVVADLRRRARPPTELPQLCRRNLTKYKLPVEITVLDELPKNAVGKIDKPSLRKTLQPDLIHQRLEHDPN